MSDTIGDFISQCDMYLQDPLHCERNVPYQNPHILFPLKEELVLTASLVATPISVSIEPIVVRPDLFDLLKSERLYPEAEQPEDLKTSLYRHAALQSEPASYTR